MAAQPFRWVMTASGVPLALSEFEAKPAPGEAVVKIAGCGVCHTDLGYYYDGCAPITRCRFALVTKSAAMSSRRDQTRTRGSAKPCARGDPMRNLRRLQALYDGQGRVAPVQSDGVPARALGNWGCRPELYPAALDLVLQGRVKVGPFVEQHPLADINKVFTAVHHGELQRRAVLVPAA